MPTVTQRQAALRRRKTNGVKRNDSAGRYELTQGGKVVGFAEFKNIGDGAVMLPHTVVD